MCNVARPNQDIFPADCLVKNCPGVLLLSVESKTLRCHWALPAGEGRKLGALCSLVKAHRCEQRLLSSSDILRNDLYASTPPPFESLILKRTLLCLLFCIKKGGSSMYTLIFLSSLFS